MTGRHWSLWLGVLLSIGVLLTFGSGPASAYESPNPPPRLNVPGSVIGGSLDSMSAAERARAVGNVVPQGTTAGRVPVSNVSTITKGGGQFLAGASAFMIGFEGTNMVMELVGVDADLIGLDALFEKDPTYEANSDQSGGTGEQAVFSNGATVQHICDSWSGGSNPRTTQATLYGVRWDAAGLPANRAIRLEWTDSLGGTGSTFGNSNYSLNATASCGYQTTGSYSVAVPHNQLVPLSSAQPANRKRMTSLRLSVCPTSATCSTGLVYDSGAVATVASVADPDRTWRSEWTCSGGGSFSADSVPFKESAAGGYPAFPAIACPAGQHPTGATVKQMTGGTGLTLKTWTPSAPVTDWFEDRPDCVGANFGKCELVLYRVHGGTDLDCFTTPEACTDWFTVAEPQRSADYKCKYGGTVVPLAECAVYAPTFNAMRGLSVGTVANPRPYGDPSTGLAVEGDPFPETGAPEVAGCPPDFNLGSLINGYWIYKGASCAIAWAFVPADSHVDTWKAQLTEALPSLPVIDVSTAGGACGVPIHLPELLGGSTFNAVPVCPGEPVHEGAGIVRVVSTAVLTLTFGVASVGLVCWAMGWNNPLAGLRSRGDED